MQIKDGWPTLWYRMVKDRWLCRYAFSLSCTQADVGRNRVKTAPRSSTCYPAPACKAMRAGLVMYPRLQAGRELDRSMHSASRPGSPLGSRARTS